MDIVAKKVMNFVAKESDIFNSLGMREERQYLRRIVWKLVYLSEETEIIFRASKVTSFVVGLKLKQPLLSDICKLVQCPSFALSPSCSLSFFSPQPQPES